MPAKLADRHLLLHRTGAGIAALLVFYGRLAAAHRPTDTPPP
jgi:hypothetical protein